MWDICENDFIDTFDPIRIVFLFFHFSIWCCISGNNDQFAIIIAMCTGLSQCEDTRFFSGHVHAYNID